MSSKTVTKKRPKHLNVFLLGLQLPFPGMVSIVNRITGAGLFIMLWFAIWLFDKSLASQADFTEVVGWLRHPIVFLVAWVMVWAFIFHACMGVRYLLLDMGIGVSLKWARFSAFAVAVVSSIISVILLFFVVIMLFPEVKQILPFMEMLPI